jgi:hypothetical protein
MNQLSRFLVVGLFNTLFDCMGIVAYMYLAGMASLNILTDSRTGRFLFHFPR